MPRPGGHSMGHSKHYKSGKPGHNRDMIQTARELNARTEEENQKKKSKKEPMYSSVKEAFDKNKK